MKKILLCLAMIAAAVASAKTIAPDVAINRVNGLTANSPMKAKSATASPKLLLTAQHGGLPTYYVFSTGSRLLFVAADDVATPLLGYTDGYEANLDNLPPQMKWWLSEYSREIAAASAAGIEPYAATTTGNRAAIEPMCKTQWHQRAPYNLLCPTSSTNKDTPTGCVATAMAQILKYHGYPSRATGTGTATFEADTLTFDLGSVTLDWDNMLDTYTDDAPGTDVQRNAVATLMKVCGYSVGMRYTTDGSGSRVADAAPALISHFGYSKSAAVEYRDYYTIDQWNEMVYDNLANAGPLEYGGFHGTGGHAFVIDGYSEDNFFHVNWGWAGGEANGYFKLNALKPSDTRKEFTKDHKAVFNIKLPADGDQAQAPYLALQDILAKRYISVSDRRTLNWNVEFSNMCIYTGTFDVRFLYADTTTGATYTDLIFTNLALACEEGKTGYSTTLDNSAPNGTYKVIMQYKLKGSDEWLATKTLCYSPAYAIITVADGAITSLSFPGPAEPNDVRDGLQCEALSAPSEMAAGESYTVTATFSSLYSTADTETFVVKLRDVVGTERVVGQQAATIPAFDIAGVDIKCAIPSDITPGLYTIALYDDTDWYYTDVSVTITASTAVSDIIAGEATPEAPSYYDLLGRKVNPDQIAPGIYIRATNGKTAKVVVR